MELAPCLTVKENCIANAEYVIEGEVIPGVRVQEDQNSHTGYAMPEFPGYTGPASSQCWLIKVKAVTHRKNPIMQTCIGPSEEHVSMAGIPTEASIYSMVEKAMPGRLQNVYCASPGGEKSHIGAVSGRVPGQEPVDIELPGHREGNLAAQWAEELYRTWEMPVWVECGIHYENLSKEGIRRYWMSAGRCWKRYWQSDSKIIKANGRERIYDSCLNTSGELDIEEQERIMEDKEKFQKNVEVVSKALKEQAGVREPEEEAKSLYKKFTQTRQEPVRLAVALRGFFLPQTGEEEKEAYGRYLKSRIRPAVEALIDEDQVEKLEIIESLGWLEGKNIDVFIRIARQGQKNAALVWLLHLKKEKYGFKDRDFSL